MRLILILSLIGLLLITSGVQAQIPMRKAIYQCAGDNAVSGNFVDRYILIHVGTGKAVFFEKNNLSGELTSNTYVITKAQHNYAPNSSRVELANGTSISLRTYRPHPGTAEKRIRTTARVRIANSLDDIDYRCFNYLDEREQYRYGDIALPNFREFVRDLEK